MALRNAFEDLATEATVANRFDGGKVVGAVQVSSLGDTDVWTPASGKRVELLWIGLATADTNGASTLAIVKLLGDEGITNRYRWPLGVPGAFVHWEPVLGAVNQKLKVNLSVAVAVEVNYTLREV